ncbi:hypothetical protein [Streptomyces phaeochromogenes]|uniref:hypothetical protein n=1 Tax=Streptomyces phaeochromogenes TaxID=1923 RepID=UPI002DD9F5D0|nr:hypothetical protein [Streptomyces phaeochromogenes]WRZ36624.1 hypothetical protein OG931_45885 [Streptomyces phaeochromogenes]
MDSTDDYRGLVGNPAFSLSLCSGQRCTTPQYLPIPRQVTTTLDQADRRPRQLSTDYVDHPVRASAN